jgi:hypothetical protein
MPRRAATVTQADVARAVRAAQQAGAVSVEVKPGGAIVIHLSPQSPQVTEAEVEPRKEIVL